MSKKNKQNDADEFVNIDDVSGDLVKCYQIQVDESGKATPVFIGAFKEIPLVTHTTIMYDQAKDLLNVKAKTVEEGGIKDKKTKKKKKGKKKNIYRIHVVTYVMPQEAIDNKIYKIVGLIVQKNKNPESVASLDLRFNDENGKFEYIYCDHNKDSVEVYKTLEKFPDNNDVLKNLVEQMFEGPIKDLILS